MGQELIGPSVHTPLVLAQGMAVMNLFHPIHANDAGVSPAPLPGDLLEWPIPGWDNAWIDLGGEG